MAVSFIKNEIRAFAVMILFCCCFSQFFGSVLRADGDLDLQHMIESLGLTTRMYHAAPDYDYIFSIESVDLQRILFLDFPGATILVYHLSQKKMDFSYLPAVEPLRCYFLCCMLPNGASYKYIYECRKHFGCLGRRLQLLLHIRSRPSSLEHHESEENFKITKYVADIHA